MTLRIGVVLFLQICFPAPLPAIVFTERPRTENRLQDCSLDTCLHE